MTNRIASHVATRFGDMGIRMTKPWQPLTAAVVAALPAQLGIYEIANENQVITKIAYAGATQPFGLRSALQQEVEQAASTPAGSLFRHECTHGYLTRWQELLMVYQADHGKLPVGNADRVGRLGRLTPGSS